MTDGPPEVAGDTSPAAAEPTPVLESEVRVQDSGSRDKGKHPARNDDDEQDGEDGGDGASSSDDSAEAAQPDGGDDGGDGDDREEEDDEDGEDVEDGEDDETDDDEPRLKYARLTPHLGAVYRNGDATSAFLVAGDKMV